jgi:catechol 2,3-dioxygenase-like lactoylglutathione lyase family enzyme
VGELMNNDLDVLSLDHVALRVPDPEEAAAYYYRVFGFQETERNSVSGAICLSVLPRDAVVVSHHDIVLYKGERAEIDHIGFAISDTADLESVADALSAKGAKVRGPDEFESVDGRTVRVQDPDGVEVELLVPRRPVLRPAGKPDFDLVKLGHITQKSPVPDKQCAWWEQMLGFRLSDHIGEDFYWIRCNRDQHSMAFVRAEEPGTHHIALELPDWDEMKRLGDHVAANGAQIDYGPGRHGPGNNLFVYIRDPWGIRWEFFCELIRIDEEKNYKPKDWQNERGRLSTVNLWGPKPPESHLA